MVVGEPDGLAIARIDPADRRFRFVGGVSDGSLRWLYEQCRLFVFPSLDEGFGLPVVEAADLRRPDGAQRHPGVPRTGPDGRVLRPARQASIGAAISRELSGEPSPAPSVVVPTWSEVVGRIRAEVAGRVAARTGG